MDEASQSDHLRSIGASRRPWLVLGVWALLLVMVIVAQGLTVGTFEIGGYKDGADTPETAAEKLWQRLPLVAIVLISGAFFLGLPWLVPEMPLRSEIWGWGVLAAMVALLVSVGVAFYVSFFIWYTD